MDELDGWAVIWRKSSYCNNSACVEIAMIKDYVLIRDSKAIDGPVLKFSALEWNGFIAGVQGGEFDLSGIRPKR